MLALLYWVSFGQVGDGGMGEVTDSVVVLDGFGDEGVDEEGDFLIRWWHFDFFKSFSPSVLEGLGWEIEA